jgi:AIR synthase-related protein
MSELEDLARYLSRHPAVVEKALIQLAYGPAVSVAGGARVGDDCAAIPNPTGNGHLLFAAEGMLESFVADDPWFAGYSAVMVNLSDIAAMGGRPLAITDVMWSASEESSMKMWQGMRAAAEAYNVPIVGGHTTRAVKGPSMLAASVLGYAGAHLITSFDAKPGDHLVIAIDMHGEYRGGKPFWNASTSTPAERLRADLELMASLSEKGLCSAGKDISNGGIAGTLAMLCATSDVGALVDLEKLPAPYETPLERWMVSFPSYGYLLAVSPENLSETLSHFVASKITCMEIGAFTERHGIWLQAGDEQAMLDFTGEDRVLDLASGF